MFLLLGAVYVHNLPRILEQLGMDPQLLDTNTPVHLLATVAVLLTPGAAAAATDAVMRLVAGESYSATQMCCASCMLGCAVLWKLLWIRKLIC